jgi:hypothetical protein
MVVVVVTEITSERKNFVKAPANLTKVNLFIHHFHGLKFKAACMILLINGGFLEHLTEDQLRAKLYIWCLEK